MKITLYILGSIVLALTALYVVSFLYLSLDSKRARETGLVGGKLRECPGTPNCVSSESPDIRFRIDPFAYRGSPTEAWGQIHEAIKESGGNVEWRTDSYLWATFRTRLWHFVDDLELRPDTANRLIHVRSASRVGKGDFGANRKRIEQIRRFFSKHQDHG